MTIDGESNNFGEIPHAKEPEISDGATEWI